VKNTLNYGANRIRYLTPVPAGSRLRGRVGVTAAEEVPPYALRVTYKVTIEIEGGKRPACVAESESSPCAIVFPPGDSRAARSTSGDARVHQKPGARGQSWTK
jgi:hypothetical protein